MPMQKDNWRLLTCPSSLVKNWDYPQSLKPSDSENSFFFLAQLYYSDTNPKVAHKRKLPQDQSRLQNAFSLLLQRLLETYLLPVILHFNCATFYVHLLSLSWGWPKEENQAHDTCYLSTTLLTGK